MTLKEFYAAVGGDYDATLNRIPKESMVLRFVKKYADDKTYAQLTEAVKAQDWETAFRASHTLKGVALQRTAPPDKPPKIPFLFTHVFCPYASCRTASSTICCCCATAS